MRVVVSTVGTTPYGIPKYLVDTIQLTLNKNQHKVKKLNIISFASSQIEPDEIQVSYEVTKLYPSLLIDKVNDVILLQSNGNYKYLETRTEITLIDIQQLVELCVSEFSFLRDNVI